MNILCKCVGKSELRAGVCWQKEGSYNVGVVLVVVWVSARKNNAPINVMPSPPDHM